MTEQEALTKPENLSTASSATPVFDAAALFNQHKKSVVRVSDQVNFGGNLLENTVGSGFAIDYLPNSKKTETGDPKDGAAYRFATDNHVVAHTSKDAALELGNGNKYPFTVELRDEANDLAIVRVENVKKDDCHPLEITDQETPLKAGDPSSFTAAKIESYR